MASMGHISGGTPGTKLINPLISGIKGSDPNAIRLFRCDFLSHTSPQAIMRYSLHSSTEDVSAEDILGVKMALETTKGAKFRRYSRVCRRTIGPPNELNRIPENEIVDSRKLVCGPQVLPSLKARAAPPGQAKTQAATPKEEIRKKRTGFWAVFKGKTGTDAKRKTTHNTHADAASLLSFV